MPDPSEIARGAPASVPVTAADSCEEGRYRRSDAHIEDDEYDAIYDEAERLADLLESLGWVCGHPYREDVIVVLRLAMNAGFFGVASGGEAR